MTVLRITTSIVLAPARIEAGGPALVRRAPLPAGEPDIGRRALTEGQWRAARPARTGGPAGRALADALRAIDDGVDQLKDARL